MKKILSLVLVFVMIFSLCVPAFAVTSADYSVPTVLIRGDGADLVTAEGEPLWPKKFGDEEGDTQEVVDAVADVLLPYFPVGLLTGNWDEYYEKFGEVMLDFFGDTALDGDGNPVSVGSKMSQWFIDDNLNRMKTNRKVNGRYDYTAYVFHYDFRLSPYDVMDELDTYIMAVMKVTGSKKVNLVGRCLGGGFLMCYLDYYLNKVETTGCEPYLKNVMFQAVTSNGCDALTSAFSGNMKFDSVALQRFMSEYIDEDSTSIGSILDTAPFVNEFIMVSYDLLREVGVIDSTIINAADSLYAELYAGLTPRLFKALFGTWAGYWTAIDTEYFEDAVDLVFGEKGSETRTEYAGLVGKIEKYHYEVSTQKDRIFDECEALGVHFGSYVKYGYQAYPFVEEPHAVSDSLVALKKASFGATCGEVGKPLSAEYIEQRAELGYGDYISVDGMVDLSTARFKDTTWVVKNLHHDNWTYDADVINNFVWSTNCTTNNDKTFSRFMVYNDETHEKETMTQDNCNTSQWEELEDVQESTLITKLRALFKWLTVMFKYLASLIRVPSGEPEETVTVA